MNALKIIIFLILDSFKKTLKMMQMCKKYILDFLLFCFAIFGFFEKYFEIKGQILVMIFALSLQYLLYRVIRDFRR